MRIKNAIVPALWRKQNPERAKELGRKFHERNPGYTVANRRKRWASVYTKRLADPNKRLAHSLRAAICGQIRRGNGVKKSSTTVLLGCTIPDFRWHIEVQWRPGMCWENWGRHRDCWQLDHIRPVASFDLTDPAQVAECFHFSNYQPLWQAENVAKGARWPG
jgi:hypothetical protein